MIGTAPFLILNLASVDEARANWRKRFENRTVKDIKSTGKIEVLNASSDVAELKILDEIGMWGVNASDVSAALDSITAKTINLTINSPGGDVFDGLAIFNMLKDSGKTINTKIIGLAASAASFIALAGDTVAMAPSAMMMVHRAWGMAIGNAGEMNSMASTLDKIDGQLAGIYAAKSGKSVDDMRALMVGGPDDDGTWMTADEAKAAGLADKVTSDDDEEDDADDVDTKAKAATEKRVRAMRARLRLAEAE